MKNNAVVCLIVVLTGFQSATARAVDAPLGAELTSDFRDAQLDAKAWKPLSPEEFTLPDAHGLTVDIPADAGAVPSAGVAGRFGLRGDFEITAEFELLDVPTPTSGYGAGATISIAATDGQGASLQRVALVDQGHDYVCHRATPQPDGTVKHVVEIVPTTARAGRIRLSRTSGKLTYLAAEGSEAEFRSLHAADFTAADVRLVHLAAQTGESPNRVKIRWKKFQAKAEELLGEDGKAPSDRRSAVWAVLAVIAFIGVVVVALKASARRSTGPNRVA